MTTYAIGDVQGCFDPLMRLLKKVAFDPSRDYLWFVGDVVNRGPQSLETLRFIYQYRSRIQMVLGNHDLSLLAQAYAGLPLKKNDTVQDILQAPDKDLLLNWLSLQPLVFYDDIFNVLMVHAGIPPQWSLETTQQEAKIVETALKNNREAFLSTMFGDTNAWGNALPPSDRQRYTVNTLTRMRFCDAAGKLDLKTKGGIERCPPGFYPWFDVPNRVLHNQTILFGHWAALEGDIQHEHAFALDTGCVWGKTLTALSLPGYQRFEVEAVPQ